MPYKEGQLTFIDFLGYQPVMALAKKGFFGKPYLTFNDFCAVLAVVYESTALVGRATCDKLSIIENMIKAPWLEPELMKSLQERANERLDEFIKEREREPHTFIEFVQVKQLENAIPVEELKGLPSVTYDTHHRDEAGGHKTFDSLTEISDLASKSKKVMKKLKMKVSLGSTELAIRIFGREGIGFGSSLPKLTERMYRNLHENTEKPPIITLEEREEEILQIVAVYTNRYWPELLDALDLRGHLEMVKEEDR